MRFRVAVATAEETMRWEDLHGATRSVVYTLIRSQDPVLGTELHERGWAGSPLRPVGMSCPRFVGAPRRPGVYTTSADGGFWLGSPVPRIATVLLAGVAGRSQLRWGATTFTITGVHLDTSPPPAAADTGEAVLRSVTPVLVKDESGYIGPDSENYLPRLLTNLEHKADVLGLPHPRGLRLVDAGRLRQFHLAKGRAFGAQVTVAVSAPPEFVAAIRDWGLGLRTLEGFGWVR